MESYTVGWQFDEQTDLLLLYQNMLLGGLQRDNFKELSRRMSEIGWTRNNDQCQQQVNMFTIPSHIGFDCMEF